MTMVMVDSVRVGRWMSQAEYRAMQATGFVIESRSGTTHVAFPASQKAFEAQATTGAYYVEFDVPRASLRITQEGWAKILGPNTLEGRLAERKGETLPAMPPVQNIRHISTKGALP